MVAVIKSKPKNYIRTQLIFLLKMKFYSRNFLDITSNLILSMIELKAKLGPNKIFPSTENFFT